MSHVRNNFLREKNRLLTPPEDPRGAYTEITARLADAEGDVLPCLAHGQEVLCLRASADFPDGHEPSLRVWEATLSSCQEFLRSLEFDLQCFVHAVYRAHNLLSANSQLQSEELFNAIDRAAVADSILLGDALKGTGVTAQEHPPQRALTTQETKAFQSVRQELRKDFDSVGDSLDSLKAGQMEIVRLFEQHRRPAAAYEPSIAAQLGAPLYSRLHQMTQRALQVVEYLYNVNQEPDGFALAAVRMAQGYENELNVRVIGPVVVELLAGRVQTYNAQGESEMPLIRLGKPHKPGMNLGSWAWYLGNDPAMRLKVSGRGFDVAAIAEDARWVSKVRNKAAHDFACDRTLADELRRRILSRDGILSRLHPAAMANAAEG